MENITTTPKINAIWIDNPRTEVTIIDAKNDRVDFHSREHALYINGVEYRVAMQDDGRIYMCGIANNVIENNLRKDSVLHIPTGWIKNPEQYHKGINCCHSTCPMHGTGRKKLGKQAPINFGAESPASRKKLPAPPQPRKKLGKKPAESPQPRKKLPAPPQPRKKLGEKPIDFGA